MLGGGHGGHGAHVGHHADVGKKHRGKDHIGGNGELFGGHKGGDLRARRYGAFRYADKAYNPFEIIVKTVEYKRF